MSRVATPLPVKLIISIFTQNIKLLEIVVRILSKKFGQIDYSGRILNFNQTQYYKKEFGTGIKRKFISFKRLIKPQNLWKIKTITNDLEEKFIKDGKRQFNLDPGYVSQANLVLASTKNFSHRIYVNKGIYQEITLIFKNKKFRPLPWSYPDYKSKEYIDIFLHIRNILNLQLKNT